MTDELKSPAEAETCPPQPRVWNKRDPNVPADAVYVGRPSKWGNPFEIGKSDPLGTGTPLDRSGVIRWYRGWIKHVHPALIADAKRELRGKDLVCWCAPLPCHADSLLEIANAG